MKAFLKKYFTGDFDFSRDYSEVVKFIDNFCAKKNHAVNGNELTTIMRLISMGEILLSSVCKEACALENIQLYTIFSPLGTIIGFNLVDIKTE